MQYDIIHKTSYHYSEPASLSQNELFLQPRNTETQKVLKTQLKIFPDPQYLHHRIDFFGNSVHVFLVQQPHNELIMSHSSTVTTGPSLAPAPAVTPAWEMVARQLAAHEQPETLDAYQYVFASPLVAITSEVHAYACNCFLPGIPVLEGAVNLMERIFNDFTYDKSATTVDTSVAQVLEARKGVCQDFAHLAISCLRSMGLAARYVSGYLETLPPPGKIKLIGADASHAWLSIFLPETGWVDLDPTNNIIAGERHVTLAWGRDYADVTPVKGVVMGGGSHRLSVMVDVMAQSS